MTDLLLKDDFMKAATEVRDELIRLGKNPVLVGMMGAGKTTTGREVARLLIDMPFTDADDVIVARGRTIPEIFAQDGEPAFRVIEADVISGLFDDRRVIGVGGGAFIEDGTREIIQENGISIWLSGAPEALHKRIAGDENRPKLKPLDGFIADCGIRYPFYKQADIEVSSEGKDPVEVAEEVVMALHAHLGLN